MSPEATAALSRTNFTLLDWAIVAGYLLISLWIGLRVRKHAGTMTHYITAGRGVGTWLGIATMTGTELGLITVMYNSEKAFGGGFATFHIAVLAGVVTFLIGLTGFVVAPLRARGVLTIPEFYERRFDRKTRVLGGIVLALGGILNMGLFLKVGSMFIVGITGMAHGTYALQIVMTVLLLLVLAYTILGGMISVVITDYVQFVVLAFGMLVATGLAIYHVGWDHTFDTVERTMGEKGFNPFVEDGPHGASYVSWMVVMGFVSCAVWPTALARALSMESPQAVKRQYMWSSISFTIRAMIPFFWGICAYVFIMTQAPDLQRLFLPAEEGADKMSALYAMPVFLGRILPVGLIGIISAAMIAAFMSTHDSYLLCWSSVLTQDVVAPLRKKPLSSRARVLLTRVFILLLGAYILWWGLFYEGGDDIWDYMAITGAIYFTGAIPVLIGGLYWKRASSTGAFLSLICGCTAVLGLEPLRLRVGAFLMGLFGGDSSMKTIQEVFTSDRVGLFAVVLTTVVFIVGSLLFPDPGEEEK